jgi:hypothetical protein
MYKMCKCIFTKEKACMHACMLSQQPVLITGCACALYCQRCGCQESYSSHRYISHHSIPDQVPKAATDCCLPSCRPACLPTQAKPWLCVSCQLQHDKQRPATQLFLHAMGYLNKLQPAIQDMGPTPACGSQDCATWTRQMAQQLKAEIMPEVHSLSPSGIPLT